METFFVFWAWGWKVCQVAHICTTLLIICTTCLITTSYSNLQYLGPAYFEKNGRYYSYLLGIN